MYLLLFPKKFEFFAFVKSTQPNTLYFSSTLNIWQLNYSTYTLYVAYFDKSDYEFMRMLSQLMLTQEKLKNLNLVLIGSCGSTVESDFGKVFLIQEAIQGDRGFLQTKNEFIFREEKKLATPYKPTQEIEYFPAFTDTTKKNISSSNFLNETDYLSLEDFSLFHMETFYFYETCKHFDITSYICFRFVTDFVFPKSPPIEDINKRIIFLTNEFNKRTNKSLEIVAEIDNGSNKKVRTEYYTILRKYHRNTMQDLKFSFLEDFASPSNDLNLEFSDKDMKLLILKQLENGVEILEEEVANVNKLFNEKSRKKEKKTTEKDHPDEMQTEEVIEGPDQVFNKPNPEELNANRDISQSKAAMKRTNKGALSGQKRKNIDDSNDPPKKRSK